MKKSLIFAGILILSFFTGFAQNVENVWTLEKCIEHANKNNLSIKISELQADYARKTYQQSYFNLLPDLGASADHYLSSGRSLNLESYEWENRKKQQGSLGIGSDLTLFSGLQNYNSIQESKFLFLKSKEDLEVLKNDITLSLAAYYLEVLFNEELLEVARSQYEVSSMQVERSRRLVEVGNSARSELYDIQAQAATDKLALTNAQTNLKLAILDLTQILDLDSVGDFQIFKPEFVVEDIDIPASVTDIYTLAKENRPEVKSAEYQVLAQKKSLAQLRGEKSPKVYLGGIYYSRYLKDAVHPLSGSPEYSYADQLKDNRYGQLTVGVDIPIFNKFQTQTNISHSKILLEEYHLKLDQSIQILYKKIQQAYADAIGAFEKYHSASEAVKSNEEAFNYARQRFDVGLVNSVDFNIAKNNLTKAKSDLVQAKFEYIFKVKILEFYQGKPIKL